MHLDTLGSAVNVLNAIPSALMTDIDGTISRIVARPDDAMVSDSARESLRSIASELALVAVVTAREESVARSLVGLDSVAYVGNYAVDGDVELVQGVQPLEHAKADVKELLADLPCVELEEKGISFALHYRNCTEEDVRQRLLSLVVPLATEAGARIIEGKRVVELVPAGLPDKGTAVAKLSSDYGLQGIVFIGDDFSDVAVFREIARRREEEGLPGLSIAVIDAETDDAVRDAADVSVAGVDEVEVLLAALAQSIAKGGAP